MLEKELLFNGPDLYIRFRSCSSQPFILFLQLFHQSLLRIENLERLFLTVLFVKVVDDVEDLHFSKELTAFDD
jgi:hypothetical protein